MKKSRSMIVAAMAAMSLFAMAPLAEATQYFDAAGGTKAWSGNWADSSAGPFNQAWVDGSGATFTGTGGTVNVDGTYSIGSATFAVDGYTLNNGTLALTGGSNMNGTGFIINSGTATVNSTLSGGANFVKLGTGTVVLTGANSYSGGTDVDEGVLSVSAISDTVGQTSNIGYNYLAVNYGGTFQYTGPDNVTTDRALWIDRAAGAYYGPSGEGATFDITQGSLTFTGVHGGGIDRTITKNGAGALGLNIAISGAAHVAVNGGTLTVGDSNTYSGGTSLEGGTLVASSIADSGTSSIGAGYLAIVNGSVLRYTGGTATTTRELWIDRGDGGAIDVTDSAATLTLSPGTGAINANFTKAGAGSLVVNKAITGVAKVTVTGGTLTVGDSNTYTEGTGIEGGTLVASSIADSGASSIGTGYLAIVNGGTLRYTGGSATTSRELWIDRGAGATFDVTNASTTLTIEPAATGVRNANLVKTGAGSLVFKTTLDGSAAVFAQGGSLTLDAANTYTGNTTLSGGSLTLGENGTMQFDVNSSASSTQVLGSGNLVLNGALKFDVADVTGSAGSWEIVVSSLSTTYGMSSLALTDGSAFVKSTLDNTWACVDGGRAWKFTEGVVGTAGVLSFTTVPEPGTISLFTLGAIGLIAYAWRKRK